MELVKSNPINIKKKICYHELVFNEMTDPVRIRNRENQIKIGKDTIGYKNFEYVRNNYPERISKKQPKTPPTNLDCSHRAFLGFTSVWRRSLHNYDNYIDDGATHIIGFKGNRDKPVTPCIDDDATCINEFNGVDDIHEPPHIEVINDNPVIRDCSVCEHGTPGDNNI